MSEVNRQFSGVRRLVVKVGSGVLTRDPGVNVDVIASLARQISEQMDQKREVILVSSGAVACGVKKIGLGRRPDKMPEKQAAAAIGQAGLILEYEKAFARYGKKVAQILLTANDLSNRQRFLNARNTLNTLLSWGVLPIINENDTVAVEEIKFGDNDSLSARVALLLAADLLVNLTDIDGLYDKDPRAFDDACRISVVSRISRQIEELASGIPGAVGTGGMLTKIKAAKKMIAAGVPMIIANGKDDTVLADVFAGKDTGTFFTPNGSRLDSRKSWIAFNAKSAGQIIVDEGARNALVNGGKSLLPSGITEVRGDFTMGAPVELMGPDGAVLGMGLVNYSAADINLIKGLKTSQIEERLGHKEYDAVIHRDNFAVTGS